VTYLCIGEIFVTDSQDCSILLVINPNISREPDGPTAGKKSMDVRDTSPAQQADTGLLCAC
jgi:hypothetical protein